MDADLVADFQEGQVGAFVAALKGQFYADKEMILAAIRRRSSFNLLPYATAAKNDILSVLKVQAGRLDLPYMRCWAAELKVADLLERAIGET